MTPLLFYAIFVACISLTTGYKNTDLRIEIYVNDDLYRIIGPIDTTEQVFLGVKMRNGQLIKAEAGHDLEDLQKKIHNLNGKKVKKMGMIVVKIYLGDQMVKELEQSAHGDYNFIVGASSGYLTFTSEETSSSETFITSESSSYFHTSSSSSFESSSSSLSTIGKVGFIDPNQFFSDPPHHLHHSMPTPPPLKFDKHPLPPLHMDMPPMNMEMPKFEFPKFENDGFIDFPDMFPLNDQQKKFPSLKPLKPLF